MGYVGVAGVEGMAVQSRGVGLRGLREEGGPRLTVALLPMLRLTSDQTSSVAVAEPLVEEAAKARVSAELRGFRAG
jgi:hypothetical protein